MTKRDSRSGLEVKAPEFDTNTATVSVEPELLEHQDSREALIAKCVEFMKENASRVDRVIIEVRRKK